MCVCVSACHVEIKAAVCVLLFLSVTFSGRMRCRLPLHFFAEEASESDLEEITAQPYYTCGETQSPCCAGRPCFVCYSLSVASGYTTG